MKYRSIIILVVFLLLLAGHDCFAQDDTASEEDTVEYAPGDTVLLQTKFNAVDDSILSYKSSKDFAYMRYLDSLLKKRTDLTIDTINSEALKGGKFKKEKLSAPPPPQRSRVSLKFLNSQLIKVIFWALAIAFICFILYKLFLTGGIFKKERVMQDTGSEDSQEEVLEPSAYDQLISRAVANKNFRLAVRYWYLQTLQKLAAAGAIQFSVDKTNYEYVRETGNKIYQKEFSSLTTNYEYVWYGRFDVSGEVYERLQKDFKFFHQKI